jgi:hypothetical protein
LIEHLKNAPLNCCCNGQTRVKLLFSLDQLLDDFGGLGALWGLSAYDHHSLLPLLPLTTSIRSLLIIYVTGSIPLLNSRCQFFNGNKKIKGSLLLNVTIVQSEPKWLKNAKNECL